MSALPQSPTVHNLPLTLKVSPSNVSTYNQDLTQIHIAVEARASAAGHNEAQWNNRSIRQVRR